jgi:recombination protein RecT
MNALTSRKEIDRQLEGMADQLIKALPSHISVDKFQRVAMTAISSDPELLNADRRSLFGAIVKAAQDGLLPDKREGALVIFNQKVSKRGEPNRYEKHVQWMPMIAGIHKKLRQSGEICSIYAHIVYSEDKFELVLGDDESLLHVPPVLGVDRGEAVGVYAIAKLKDGTIMREVMTRADIEKVRSVSKSGEYGPWKDWWDEMWKKTVIRRLSKRLPMSTDLERVINDDTTQGNFALATVEALGTTPRLTRADLQRQAQSPAIEHQPAAELEPEPEASFSEILNDGIPALEGDQGQDAIDPPHDDDGVIDDAPEPEPSGPPAWIAKHDEILAGVNAAATVIDLNAWDAEYAKHCVAMPPTEANALGDMIADKRAALTGKK